MLTIRLTRKGKKNQPFFKVVVIDKRRSSKGGRAVEDLGYKNPLTKKVSIKKERVLYWISKGAKPSPSIHNLLVSEKIIDAKKIHVSKLSTKKKAEISASAKAAADKEKADADAKAAAEAKPAEPATPAETPVEKPAETPKEEPKPA
jgi:small subunit ribosomal protein S16